MITLMAKKKNSLIDPHEKLINRIQLILENSKFEPVDSHVYFYFGETDEPDFEIDVAALEDDTMFVFECKTGKFDHSKTEFNRINSNIELIIKDKVKKIKSTNNKINLENISKIRNIYYGFVLQKQSVFDGQKNNIKKAKMLVWNNNDIKYFNAVSKTLENATKYEIYKEFGMNGPGGQIEEKAVRLWQGKNEIFLFSLLPKDLLEIGYVSRRGTKRDESYQRIINPNRLHNLTKFIQKPSDLLMPNPVILALDKDIGDKLNYSHDGTITFPKKYCSAWIVDGQHRIFSFKDIDLSEKKWAKANFKIPVTVFKRLDIVPQSETFVNINYYQKRIEPLLIYDLASTFKNLRNELVWPSRLAKSLNDGGALKGKIRIGELESKPLKITMFVRPFLDQILGFNYEKEEYEGPLYMIKEFDRYGTIDDEENKKAFYIHSKILKNFFQAVHDATPTSKETDWFKEAKKNRILHPTTIGALILVLSAILWSKLSSDINFSNYMKVLKIIDFTTAKYTSLPRGYGAVKDTAKFIIKEINKQYGMKLELKLMSERRKEQETIT